MPIPTYNAKVYLVEEGMKEQQKLKLKQPFSDQVQPIFCEAEARFKPVPVCVRLVEIDEF